MSESADAEKKGKGIEPGNEISDLAGMLATVNRLSDRLQKALEELGVRITVTDWLLLRVLQEEGALSMADIARHIGVTRQRVHQQTKAATSSGWVTLGEGADAKTKPLSLTAEGKALMGRIDDVFTTALSANTGALPTGPIHGGRVSARRVLRAMAPKKPMAETPEE